MSQAKKPSEDEMIACISQIIKSGISCHGYNTDLLAKYLVKSGCKIHIGPKMLKYLAIINER